MMTNGQDMASLVDFSLIVDFSSTTQTKTDKIQVEKVDISIWWEDLRTGFRLNIQWQMAKIWPVWLD